MGFEIKNSGGNIVLCPAGSHVARCYMTIDEGTHPEEFQGEFKGNVQKCRIGFELPLKKHTFIEEKGEEPFTLSQQFTYSLHEKAKLRKTLESWKGQQFSDAKLAAFRKAGIPCLIGQTCLINVIHKPRAAGGHYANIATVMPLPEGMVCPPAIMKPIIFTVDAPLRQQDPVFLTLSKWLQEEISKCLEWCPKPAEPPANHGTAESGAGPEKEDDNPF